MFKNRKFNRNAKKTIEIAPSLKRQLNPIDENTTIKITRVEGKENASSSSTVSTKASIEAQGNLEEMFSSEENIPASQEPTQRYLSQRSTFVGSLCRTQSRTITQRPPNTYFELVLMKAGVQLDEPENFVLSCDHVVFVSKLREIFLKSQNYPENVETFKTGLRDALNSKSKQAQKLLSGCTISIPGENSVYQSQDSMIVSFLIIDFLKDHVLEVLLEKIEKAACESSPPQTSENIPLLPLMLAQLRYVVLTHGEFIYTRIKDIFEKCNDAAKCDIISNAEFILDTSKHDKFTQLLLDNVPNSKDLFNTSTIQTLTNLCLSTRMQGKLRSKIIAFIKENQCPTRTLPFLIKFLLKILNENNDDCMHQLVTALREILIWNTNGQSKSNDKQSQLELFHFINQGLTRSKRFYEIWLKTIASLPASQFRSIDFVILLLLIYIKEDRAFYIENMLRRRIKLEHITVDIINETKTKYGAVLELHINTLMQILHNFLHEKHKNVSDFARAAYGILFEIGDSVQKNIFKKLLELTCDKSSTNMTTQALELLKDLQRKYTKEFQNWGILLMPLLDRLNDMTLSQTRLVMEILCLIAYPAPNVTECPVLQDQIDMLVKKQMINRTSIVKKQGIIGCVQLIDSIARVEETVTEMDDSDTTFNQISDLPEGRGKIAAQYVERVHSSTMHCAESLALFYDELATVCTDAPIDRANKHLLDKPFIIWLCELMTSSFQINYIAEDTPENIMISGIELSCQKCINTKEDANSEGNELPSIAINIAELVLKPKTDATSSILVLAPLFNIVRVLHLQRFEGSLELINALLGCAILLPTFFDDPEAMIYDFDADVRKKVLDIYFHCVNWIRETVSSFTTQRLEMIRNKVLMRLTDLIQIEDTVRKLLLRAPADYMPPLCQFITPAALATGVNTSKAGGRGRPATHTNQKSNKINHNARNNEPNETEALVALNETNVNNTIIGGNSSKTVTNKKPNFDCIYGAKEIYRQMDSDIMHILREKLTLQYPLPVEKVGKSIGLLEYRFIMHDLVSKLESVTGVQKFSSEQTLQYIAKPYYFINDLAKFFNAISRNMEQFATAIINNLEKVKYMYGNADLFTDELNFLKVNFGLSLRLLAAFFAWSEFMNAESKTAALLKESLLVFIDRSKFQRLKSQTNDEIAQEVFNKCLKYESNILDLKTAVYLYQLLLSLRKLSQKNDETDEKHSHEIRSLCKQLLLRKWYNFEGHTEKGALCNIYLDELVKGFLKKSNFRRQREILRIVLDEIKHLGGKDNAMKSFPNFKKANFPILFRGLCEILITTLNDKIPHDEDAHDKLNVWEKSCELLNMLLEVVQGLDVPRNFQLFLKYSHMYLKIVLQHGLQVYEQFLRQNPERVNALLKSLQVTTRFLHNLCCHSKALKNTAIVNQIPFLRETVETLVFRVKALLTANKCAGVFWMGNLKNKDLHGDEILTQSDTLSAATPDSDEEIPEDDASVDETVVGQNVSSTHSDNITDDRVTNNRSKSSSRSKCF